MAKVTGPFFSTFATGSCGKTLTVSALYNGNKFVIGSYKSYAGKRHPIQIHNAKVFKERIRAHMASIKDYT